MMGNTCTECGKRFDHDCHRQVEVQYLTGTFDDTCRTCVERKVGEGTIVMLTQRFIVGHTSYEKGYVGSSVMEHIKRVFDERRRDAA